MSNKRVITVYGNFNRPSCCALKADMEFPERGNDERSHTGFRQKLRDNGKFACRVQSVGNSVGACLPGSCPIAFLTAADAALYRTKQSWRNCIRAA
jgi:hypothetical protein